MLLTLDDMNFISQATFGGKNGQLVAKTDLLEEKERLLDVDERNLITYGAHSCASVLSNLYFTVFSLVLQDLM